MKNFKLLLLVCIAVLAVPLLHAQDTKKNLPLTEWLRWSKIYRKRDQSVRMFIEGGCATIPKKAGIGKYHPRIDGRRRHWNQIEPKSKGAEKSALVFQHQSIAGTEHDLYKMFWDDSMGFIQRCDHASCIFRKWIQPDEGTTDCRCTVKPWLIRTLFIHVVAPVAFEEKITQKFRTEQRNHWKILHGKMLWIITKELSAKKEFLSWWWEISQEDITKKKSSSAMPGVAASKESRVVINQPKSYGKNRDIATNYIRGIMSAPVCQYRRRVRLLSHSHVHSGAISPNWVHQKEVYRMRRLLFMRSPLPNLYGAFISPPSTPNKVCR